MIPDRAIFLLVLPDLFTMTGRILNEIDFRLPLYRIGPLKSVPGLLENLTIFCNVGCE
jgi:hypothetical protein